jgi:UDP-xylose:glucoside alpha-1,3-xylosyltransferase
LFLSLLYCVQEEKFVCLVAEKLYVFACDWNYRMDHCMYGSTCKAVDEHGASILHGSRQSFHNDEQPAFKAVYEAIRDVSVASL